MFNGFQVEMDVRNGARTCVYFVDFATKHIDLWEWLLEKALVVKPTPQHTIWIWVYQPTLVLTLSFCSALYWGCGHLIMKRAVINLSVSVLSAAPTST